MNYLLWLAGFLALMVLIIIVFNPKLVRLAKVLYLISRTHPYEQTVANAPKILILGDSTGYGTGVYNPSRFNRARFSKLQHCQCE